MKIELHNGIYVLRDDLLEGGTKSTFLPGLLAQHPGATKFVYATPVYGGFQIALANVCNRFGYEAHIFCAEHNQKHPNTLKAMSYPRTTLHEVRPGYLSVVEARAREYAEKTPGAVKLTFGADYPEAIAAISQRMQKAINVMGEEPDEIFCAVGSGTLLKGILAGTKKALIYGVCVGKEFNETLGTRVALFHYPKPFQSPSRQKKHFPSCENYDLKAWEFCLKYRKPAVDNTTFFWNVL